MAPSVIPILIAGMLATGVANSIFSKWQDMQCVEHCGPNDPHPRVDFSQPVWQTLQMFLGECLCLIPPMAVAFWAWVRRPRASLFKSSSGEYAAVGSSPPMSPTPGYFDEGVGDSGFSNLDGEDEVAAGNSAFSFLNPQNWFDDEHSSSAFSRLVPAFWPVWKAPPTPGPGTLRRGAATPGGARAAFNRSLSGAPAVNAQGERIPANATAAARAIPEEPLHPERPSISIPPEVAARIHTPEPEEETDTVLKGKAIFLFLMPAACDICGTTLMNVGLLFTPVSIYQMTRGALVLWVGVFSVLFLQRQLFMFQWLSLLAVMLGVCIVGISGTLLQPTAAVAALAAGEGFTQVARALVKREETPDAAKAFIGVLLILFAQLFTAGQFVLEEKIMSRYSVEPLLAVGYEGMFGSIITFAAQIALHYFYGRTKAGHGGYFDMVTGWRQLTNEAVLWSGLAVCLSIALFNFFGLSVTRTVSATARSTIDTCRTLGIWAVSLALGWEVFRPLSGFLQMIGFALLCGATLLFNGVIPMRLLPRWLRPSRPEIQRRRTRSQLIRSQSYHASASSRSRSRPQRSHSTYVPVQTEEPEAGAPDAPQDSRA